MSENLKPTEIVVHHSDGNDGAGVQWSGIRKWHMGTPPNGPADGPYQDIAYHAGVELVNDHYEILIGRMWNTHSAHTVGHNGAGNQPLALGVCVVGNFTLAPPPEAQLALAARLVKMWMAIFNIPITKVYRHKDLNDTDCPGDAFPWEQFKNMLG